MRRCGESTLLGQLIERHGLKRERCLSVNFEDPRLAAARDHTHFWRDRDEVDFVVLQALLARLHVPLPTVRSHAPKIHQKLHVHGRREAVERAVALGLQPEA